LRKRIAEKGLAVEINPSSNLMIGQLGDLLNHPMWRIKNPASIKAEPTIPIIIGSDDPVTFSTRLPDEYAMLFDAMVDAGLSSDDAFAWLDTARQYGNDYRFTTSDAFNVKNS
jgi:adenosine deaminase